MAKRQTSDIPDPFDDEFGDVNDITLDELRVEDLDIDGIDQKALIEPMGSSASVREPLTVGVIIVSAIKVILIAIVALAVFLGIAFGAVYAGQRFGVVAQRGGETETSLASVPTAAPATPIPAVVATTDPAAGSTGGSVSTIDCPSAASWWNAQQIQENFTYFSQTAITDVRGTNRLNAQMEQMRIRRDFVDNFTADPCLNSAKSALVAYFNAVIEAARVEGSDGSADNTAQFDAANTAGKTLQSALAQVGVNIEVPEIAQ